MPTNLSFSTLRTYCMYIPFLCIWWPHRDNLVWKCTPTVTFDSPLKRLNITGLAKCTITLQRTMSRSISWGLQIESLRNYPMPFHRGHKHTKESVQESHLPSHNLYTTCTIFHPAVTNSFVHPNCGKNIVNFKFLWSYVLPCLLHASQLLLWEVPQLLLLFPYHWPHEEQWGHPEMKCWVNVYECTWK